MKAKPVCENDKVYILWKSDPESLREIIIGIFACKSMAENEKEKMESLPYRRYEDYFIEETEVIKEEE